MFISFIIYKITQFEYEKNVMPFIHLAEVISNVSNIFEYFFR